MNDEEPWFLLNRFLNLIPHVGVLRTIVINIDARRNKTIIGKLKFCVADNPVKMFNR